MNGASGGLPPVHKNEERAAVRATCESPRSSVTSVHLIRIGKTCYGILFERNTVILGSSAERMIFNSIKSICADTKKNNNALRHTVTSYQSEFQLYTAEYANQLQLAQQVHAVSQKQFTMMMHQIEQEKQRVLCKLEDRQARDMQHH